MQVEITGRVVNILPTQSGKSKNGNDWVKNSFVIEWNENGYAQHLCLEVAGEDKFEKMKNAVKVGCDVLCKFSVSSREWNGKYFTTAQCFYCASVGSQQQTVNNDPSHAVQSVQQAPPPIENELPF